MAEDVGGFFASLKMVTDEGSFSRGVGHLKSARDSLAGLIKTGLAITGVTLGLKSFLDASREMGQTFLTSNYLDMSARSLITWRNVVAEAGGSAEGFVNSLKGLHQTMTRIFQEGTPENSAFFKNLGLLLGNQMPAFMKADTAGQTKMLMSAAATAKNADLANDLILQLLGPDALQVILAARTTPGGLAGMLGRAGQRVLVNQRDVRGAQAGVQDWNRITNEVHNLWQSISAKGMTALAPALDRLATWLEAHQADLTKLADNMALLAEKLGGFLVDTLEGHNTLGRILGGTSTTSDWFPNGLPWQGSYWQNFGRDMTNLFDGKISIGIEDRTQGGVKVVPKTGMSGTLSDAAAKALLKGTR